MVNIKICGITREEDAIYAVEQGATALGFIFYRKSPRYITPVKAARIVKELPPFIDRVGVFVDMPLPGIINIIRKVGLSVVQLHGNETHEYCYNLKKISSIPIIKAFRVQNIESINHIKDYYDTINAALLDTYQEDAYGGTGEVFNWDLAVKAKRFDRPIILSGGLKPDNIIDAYQKVKPYGLDINSGIESSAGVKDREKIKELFQKVVVIKSL